MAAELDRSSEDNREPVLHGEPIGLVGLSVDPTRGRDRTGRPSRRDRRPHLLPDPPSRRPSPRILSPPRFSSPDLLHRVWVCGYRLRDGEKSHRGVTRSPIRTCPGATTRACTPNGSGSVLGTSLR